MNECGVEKNPKTLLKHLSHSMTNDNERNSTKKKVQKSNGNKTLGAFFLVNYVENCSELNLVNYDD